MSPAAAQSPPESSEIEFALAPSVYTIVVLSGVRFSWDPKKSEANLAARGFDFEFAALIFERVTLERTDDRRDYGERRVLAVGLAQGIQRRTWGETERRIIFGAKEQSP